MNRILLSAFILLLCALALPGAKTLDMWVVDTEGGKAVLILSPSGQSMLIDTGFPGINDRDTTRIVEACQAAGVKKLDILVTTHYDLDHVNNTPSLLAKIPAAMFVDHGPSAVEDPAHDGRGQGLRRPGGRREASHREARGQDPFR